ncbi:MAG: VCBS repeat-containing protein [Bacteroidota bacterium]|nr:VCBS repeat-containing protein [Bacteroidota bacterium]
MKRTIRIWVLGMALLFVGVSCEDGKMFRMVSSRQSGITFSNDIKETEEMNILGYLYMYNGGGVAIGDINNDGLPDIYFSSNQKPNKLYLNKGGLEFEDITEKAHVGGGTSTKNWTNGVTMVDINNDGWLDIYVCMMHGYKELQGGNLLFVNNGDGTITENAKKYGLDARTYAQQAAFFDYDLDGDLDMYLLNQAVHTPNSYKEGKLRMQRDSLSGDRLYRNDEGFFKNVSESSGIYGGAMGYGLAVAIGDVDNNGYPDIYVSNDFHENDYLYYNQGDGTFKEDMKDSFGHVSTFSMGSNMADINNDGLLDLVTLDMRPENETQLKRLMSVEDYDVYQFKIDKSYHFQYPRNMLQINQGNLFGDHASFSEIGEISGISATDWSWAVLCADFDLDGRKDLYITNGIPRRPNDLDFIKYASDDVLKKENFQYEKVIRSIPGGEATNIMYQNDGKKFKDVSKAWGLDLMGNSNGAACADLDNDGDLDIVVNNLNATASIYENKVRGIQGDNNFLKVKLIGGPQNPKGIGGRVVVIANENKQVQELFTTKGWLSSMDYELVFGLAKADNVKVSVDWGNGKKQQINSVKTNTTLILNYADAQETHQLPREQGSTFFKNVSYKSGIDFIHQENDHIDFKYERLIPRMLSRQGPKVAVGDVNNDGLDDFYIGGAKNQEGELYLQQPDAETYFIKKTVSDFYRDRGNEDAGAVFFDIDTDMDLDLYVVGGSGEPFRDFSSTDRIYINDGHGNFTKSVTHPKLGFNGSCVVKADFNEDGIDDLFVGARSTPGAYGKYVKSHILWGGGSGALYDVTERIFGDHVKLGMVTDAVWLEDTRELVIVGEWMPVTVLDFKNPPLVEQKILNTQGWWNTVRAADIDNDGDQDLFLGNMGCNTNLRPSLDYPINLYLKDFDGNSSLDPILTYYKDGLEYPYFGLDELATQLTALKKVYLSYESYANSTFSEVFPREELQGSGRLQAFTFESAYFERDQTGSFVSHELPYEMQWAPLYAFAADDFNKDGQMDVLAGGNFYANQLNIGKCDASFGHFLTQGDNMEGLVNMPGSETGFVVNGEIRDIKILNTNDGEKLVLVSRNNGAVQLFSY